MNKELKAAPGKKRYPKTLVAGLLLLAITSTVYLLFWSGHLPLTNGSEYLRLQRERAELAEEKERLIARENALKDKERQLADFEQRAKERKEELEREREIERTHENQREAERQREKEQEQLRERARQQERQQEKEKEKQREKEREQEREKEALREKERQEAKEKVQIPAKAEEKDKAIEKDKASEKEEPKVTKPILSSLMPKRWSYPTICAEKLVAKIGNFSRWPVVTENVTNAQLLRHENDWGPYDRLVNETGTAVFTIKIDGITDNPDCDMSKVLTHDNVLACVQERHIMFIGDSTMRFQSTTFMHFLRWGLWISGYDGNTKIGNISAYTSSRYAPEQLHGPAVHVSGDSRGGGWNEFARDVHKVLSPFLISDTYRWGDEVEKTVEILYYRDPRLNIRVTFLGLMGIDKGQSDEPAYGRRTPTQGHYLDFLNVTCDLPSPEQIHSTTPSDQRLPVFGCNQSGCQPGDCELTKTPNTTWWTTAEDKFAGIRKVVHMMKPDLVLLNTGRWSKCITPDCIANMSKLEQDLAPMTTLMWKTWPSPVDKGNQKVLEDAVLLRQGSPWLIHPAFNVLSYGRTLAEQHQLQQFEILNDGDHWGQSLNAFLNQHFIATQICSPALQDLLQKRRPV